ncbi:uncharacterized protein LOC119079444 isoform X1 [Bradysia coprophila]|uniref:uncharacterized protein LOC119079444 isoform X1 n=1 Tax=Bradysia coprophila TaxID=38358 RepID=UPI00187DACFC|nr:uncharacterized protein LOC119079444 isoform X1 [Bradysia coprophila]
MATSEPSISSTDPVVLANHYRTIIEENKVFGSKIINKIVASTPDLHGEHACSSCDYLTIQLQDETGTESMLQVFVKRQILNASQMEMVVDMQFFQKEAGLFNEVVPMLNNFIATKVSGDLFKLDMIPTSYFANEEVIMMENLVTKGFTSIPKIEKVDLERTIIVLGTLAKFHAPSYLLLKEETQSGKTGSIESFLDKHPCLKDCFLFDTAAKHLQGWFGVTFETAGLVLESFESTNKDSTLQLLDKVRTNVLETFQKNLTVEDGHLCFVINHGDFLNNNMMFLVEQNSRKVMDHVLIDFQRVHLGSPNLDIAYFLFTSVKSDVRRQKWKDLLKIYYGTFQKHVKTLGGTVDFSFEELVADFRRKFFSGFVFGVLLCCMAGMIAAQGDLDKAEENAVDWLRKSISSWVRDNPQKVEEIGQELCGLLQEYKNLTTDH